MRTVHAGIECWPLKSAFRISRSVRTVADVVTVKLSEGEACGRGECAPYPRYGESADSVLAQIRAIEGAIFEGATRTDLPTLLPAGAARNAVDCALWDLEFSLQTPAARERGDRVLPPVFTALTVSLDQPDAMGRAARDLRGTRLVKVKVDGNAPEACLQAVRAEVPDSTLIVDANEGWSMPLLERLQPLLAELGVAFVEQPLPAAQDSDLAGFARLVPICADESCHTAADLDALRGRYDLVNIKLDKTGGLTGALELMAEARRLEFGVMVGCMICTSLSIAPAFHVAAQADYTDLDGPLWLKEDRSGGVQLEKHGQLLPPVPGFWGPSGTTKG